MTRERLVLDYILCYLVCFHRNELSYANHQHLRHGMLPKRIYVQGIWLGGHLF